MAESHQTVKRIKNTLSIVYTQFPHLEEIQPYPLRKTHTKWWNYNAIRRVKMKEMPPRRYVNMFYSVCIDFDKVSHGWITLQRLLLPPKESIYFKLGYTCKRGRLVVEYAKIYKRRLYKLARACFST